MEASVILTVCAASDVEQVKALLEKNPALINAQDDIGATPLSRAVGAVQPSKALVKLLLDRGANVEGSTKFGQTPLHSAANRGRKDVVLLLLAHGANIHARDRNGSTVMDFAAFRDRMEVADVLLAHGAEMSASNAAALGKVKALEELLRRDPESARAEDNRGLMPLHWAAMHGHTKAVRLLLAHGASAFQENRYGYTPCFFAREFKRADIVKLMRCP
jgi:ankyrin repeat protein